MEKQSDKFDASVKRIIGEGGLENPSFQFTESVLKKIEAKQKIAFKPLISKRGWAAVAAVAILLAFLFVRLPITGDFEWLPALKTAEYFTLNWEWPNFNFSMITTVAVGCFVMFLVEIPFLKNYFERQLK